MKLLDIDLLTIPFLITPIPGQLLFRKMWPKNLYKKRDEYLQPYNRLLGVFFGIIYFVYFFLDPIRVVLVDKEKISVSKR